MDFSPESIARQMTILDNELFQKVDVSELHSSSSYSFCVPHTGCNVTLFLLWLQVCEMLYWAKEQNEEKSPMLTQFTLHFNNVSQWSVCTSYIIEPPGKDTENKGILFLEIPYIDGY